MRTRHSKIELGTRFTRLTVVDYVSVVESSSGRPRQMCKCQCDCGKVWLVRPRHLTSGAVKSCGCFRNDNTSKRFASVVSDGEIFGWLTIVSEVPRKNGANIQNRKFVCRCRCGVEKTINLSALKTGRTKSCGCYNVYINTQKSTTHGMSKTETYQAWSDMMKRGNGSNRKKDYYDRGIRVCKEWHNFEVFLRDMGEKPKNKTLDRIDNGAGYSPKNCRWATSVEQANNKRNNLILEYRGKNYTQAELARKSGHPYSRLQMRLRSGWSVEKAVNTPKQSN